MDWLEEFWGDLLSEEPLRIVAAWSTLGDEEKIAVHNHLLQMASEEGWADIQQVAAQTALRVIDQDSTTDASAKNGLA